MTHPESALFTTPNQIPARRWRHLRRYQPVPAGCVPRNRPEWAQFGHICRSCRDDETFPWIKCAVVNLHAIERKRGSKEISWALSDLVVEWLVATQFWCIWRCLGSFWVNYIEISGVWLFPVCSVARQRSFDSSARISEITLISFKSNSLITCHWHFSSVLLA